MIFFADDGSPRLRISPTYHQHARSDGYDRRKPRILLRKRCVRRSICSEISSIAGRRSIALSSAIVTRQRDFLDKGVEYIKPMMLKDVAEDIGMHLSTISRVVNRKYAHTPQGVIELRRFFSEGMMNEDGEEVSTRILKLRIKKMVEDEDRNRR